MEQNLNLNEVVKLLKRNLKNIIALTLTFALISFLVSIFLIKPVYQSEVQVIVNQKGKNIDVYNPGQVQTNLQLINTYSQMVNSKTVRSKVISNLNLKSSEESLKNRITVLSEPNSQLMKILVKGPNTKSNAEIANELAKVTQKEVERTMGVDNLSIFSKADTNEKQSPINPKPLLNALMAGMFGLLLSIAIILLKRLLDNRLNNEEKVEKYLNLPTLGKINRIED
ncbi:YveK family protein [Macrococcus brunensis]|uniref:YveK family protein n=1 Tax=Macrococcus brunensis TaxID=198483 RepID=UPI001EEF8F12|nr:Wzz/FepE/Etk N-terminal domain-containing protein [Macrococcus brunensis]ULG72694.1 Wzz/FepE/Etk N-terminal domain-containing protein [Macrococcus brunensis]